jgi:putative membrane protein
MSTNRMFAAALAAALAVPVSAQIGGNRAEPAPAQQPSAQPAPAPAPAQPGAQAQTGAQAQQQLTEEQKSALGTISVRNQLAVQAGQLAQTRGATAEVKNLGQRLVDEHQRAQSQLGELVRQRGADLNALPQGNDRQRLEGELAELGTKSGEEFDRAFVAFVTRNHPTMVAEVKRARDATAGKDASFKKWLDDYENLEEEHLNVTRQLKQQRQARTPPAR